jgi:glycosyltransferase involved in cell wall biosynthesis
MMPVISVIMPVRNGREWLREAIESIFAQTFGDFEFLIVDDGSDHETAAALDAYAGRDRRIRLIRQTPQGIVAALNRAVDAACSPYLARLDADDRARPERLARQLAYMQANRHIGLLGSFAEKIDAAGAIVGRLTPPGDAGKLRRMLHRTNPFIHSSVMMRTALVRQAGGYRTAFRAAEDYDLWLRMAEAGGIAVVPEILIQYRLHETNLSRLDAIRQSFSVRLAQRSAAARRRGISDPASGLETPPDWWAGYAETSFFAEDVALYRFFDAELKAAADHLSAVRTRLLSLNHVERKLAQSRLNAMLHAPGLPTGRRLRILTLMTMLHPGRAASLVWTDFRRAADRRRVD